MDVTYQHDFDLGNFLDMLNISSLENAVITVITGIRVPMAQARNSKRFQDHRCVPVRTAAEGGLLQFSLVHTYCKLQVRYEIK